MDRSFEVLVSNGDVRNRLATAEEKVPRVLEERGKLNAELRDAKLKLELMDVWKKRARDADEKAAAALAEAAEVKGDLRKAVKKSKEFEGNFRMVETESGRRWIRLITVLVN